MGLGGYIFCELCSIQAEFPEYKQAFAKLESKMITKCDTEWAPKKMGYLNPRSDPPEYGRTTILPELFDDVNGAAMAHWRQYFIVAGNQTIITGGNAGNTLPEDIKVAWIGLAFPNEQLNISEIKWQLGDRKYGRINIEDLHSYKKPAVIFEEGIIIDEEQSFDLYAYVDGPIPTDHQGNVGLYQRVVMLGAAYYKIIDKVLGVTGAAIT